MSFGNPFSTTYDDGSGVQGIGYNGFEVSLNYISGLPDPNIISNSTLKLIFKSLLKRDETTKEKALSELISYITPENINELQSDLVLITWIQLYPKLSISESKIVRSLSHQVETSLISLLQKNFVKYLKDSVPVLLSGLYDFDLSVSNSTLKNLGHSFNNDQKKINNIWIIFQSEILNFADQTLNKETVDSLSDDRFVSRDEAELKYLRLVNSSISIVSHLIQLRSKLYPEKFAKIIEDYQKFFTYENLWHYLLINSNTNNQRIFKTLLSLLNATAKVNPELITEKAWKLLSKRFFKSLTFVKKVDTSSSNAVIYSSLIIPIISTLNNLNTINREFYQYDKSHKERIIEFLKIGSLNSDASYYTRLLEFLKESPIFEFSDAKDSSVLSQILLKDLQTEILKNSKLRTGADFILNSLNTSLEIATKVNSTQVLSSILQEAFKVKTQISSRFVEPLVKHIPKNLIADSLSNFSSGSDLNIILLLKIATKTSTPLDDLLTNTLDSLRSKADGDESGESYLNDVGFEIYQLIIKENVVLYKEQVEDFIDELPTYITSIFIDKPIQILLDYSKSEFYSKDLFIETFDSFLIKLSLIDSKDILLTKLDSFHNKDELLNNSESLKTAIEEASSSYEFKDDSLFKSHLLNEESAIDLYNSAKSQDKLVPFFDFLWKNNHENDVLIKSVAQSTNILSDVLWKNFLQLDIHERLLILSQSDESFQKKYLDSLLAEVTKGIASEELNEFVSRVSEKNPSILDRLTTAFSLDSISTAYGEVIDSRLSIGNPLGTNLYLLNTLDGSFQFDKLAPLINYGYFLSKVNIELSNDLLIFISILSEILNDYEFLQNDKSYVDLQFDIKSKLLIHFIDETFTSVFEQLSNDQFHNEFLEKLSIETNEILAFYKLRVLQNILNDLISNESIAKIKQLNLENYVKTNIRLKDPIQILKFTTIISSLVEIWQDDKYERIRNLVGSELIGIKTSEILTVGLTKLIIWNNFIDVNSEIEPLQQQRFNLILNDLNKWIESDVVYEDDFSKLRIVLLQLLTSLNSLPFEKTQLFQDLTINVLQNSSGLIVVEDDKELIELKYYTLKLYLVLKKQQEIDGEVLKDVETEVLENFLQVNSTITVNQPVIIYNELLNRFLKSTSKTEVERYYDQILVKYGKVEEFDLKRTLLELIQNTILSRQQDLVIEFELSKPTDETEDSKRYEIDQIFIDNILNIPEFQDDEDVTNDKLIEYLWNWKLVLTHFIDITLKLRSVYIHQLESSNEELISKFLNFISLLIIHYEDKKTFWKEITEDDSIFIDYKYDNAIDDNGKEVIILAIHLFYTTLKTIGSSSILWFNNIKDRGFKQKIETFTTNYISPSLITSKLQDFESKIDKFTNDENLSIKVNKIIKEIKVSYIIDEQHLEIIYKIPSNFPLANIEVLGTSRVGVKENQWKAWLMATQRIIIVQNGEISDSLEFFLKNVSFHFKDFEECAICYSILHQDNSLPSKTCSTCKNKFHAGCLYKWFKSSGGNTCPLCRSTFNFR